MGRSRNGFYLTRELVRPQLKMTILIFTTLLQQICYQPCPTRLVTCTDACPIISVEVFVEQQQIAPVRIALEFFYPTVDGSAALGIPQKNTGQAARKFVRHLLQVHQDP